MLPNRVPTAVNYKRHCGPLFWSASNSSELASDCQSGESQDSVNRVKMVTMVYRLFRWDEHVAKHVLSDSPGRGIPRARNFGHVSENCGNIFSSRDIRPRCKLSTYRYNIGFIENILTIWGKLFHVVEDGSNRLVL